MKRDLEQHITSALNAEKLSGDEDEVLLGKERHVLLAQYARERSGEVDIGARLLLNGLDDAALATRDDVVELVVNFADLGVETTLRREPRMSIAESTGGAPRRTSSSSSTSSLTLACSTLS